jgi:hypothetical protein
MILLYALFSKVVPIISRWELKAGDPPPPVASAKLADARPVSPGEATP